MLQARSYKVELSVSGPCCGRSSCRKKLSDSYLLRPELGLTTVVMPDALGSCLDTTIKM